MFIESCLFPVVHCMKSIKSLDVMITRFGPLFSSGWARWENGSSSLNGTYLDPCLQWCTPPSPVRSIEVPTINLRWLFLFIAPVIVYAVKIRLQFWAPRCPHTGLGSATQGRRSRNLSPENHSLLARRHTWYLPSPPSNAALLAAPPPESLARSNGKRRSAITAKAPRAKASLQCQRGTGSCKP